MNVTHKHKAPAADKDQEIERLRDQLDHASYRHDVLNESGNIMIQALYRLADLSPENREIVDKALSDVAEVC